MLNLLLDPLRLHPGDLGEPLDLPRLLPVVGGKLVGLDLERERGPVADQDLAVAIHDLAAGRLHLHLADAVVLRLLEVLVAGEHLEVPEAEEDDEEHHQRAAAQDRDAQGELRGHALRPVFVS